MQKSKSIFLSILFVSFLLILMPAFSAQAQDDVQPIDDEFIDALVMMSVSQNLMDGDLGALRALKDFVNGYYSTMIAAMVDIDPVYRTQLIGLRQEHITMINDRIDLIEAYSPRNQVLVMLGIFTDEKILNIFRGELGLPRFVAGRDTLPSSSSSLDSLGIMTGLPITDPTAMLNMALDVNTITAMPSAAPVINDQSGWSYNVPAITNSTAGGSGADFWGDAGDGDGGGQSSGPTEDIRIHKPVRFVNNGFEAVTVVVESYDPAPGLDPTPSNASTVVFPENSSSASLSLPQGTYTFCYYWQLDEDYNNDDYFDYHHRTTATVSLNENSSDNVNNAVLVTLNPDSNVSNPNGKCGEIAAQNNGSLTPEEQANAGTHTYSIYYHAPGVEGLDGDTSTATVSIVFSDGILTMGTVGQEQFTLTPAGTNTYTWLDDNGNLQTYIFTMDGFEAHFLFVDAEVTSICTRQDYDLALTQQQLCYCPTHPENG